MPKKNHDGGNWPYHLYEGGKPEMQGSYVPCDTNPCHVHGNSEIYATSPEEAYGKAHEYDDWGFTSEPAPANGGTEAIPVDDGIADIADNMDDGMSDDSIMGKATAGMNEKLMFENDISGDDLDVITSHVNGLPVREAKPGESDDRKLIVAYAKYDPAFEGGASSADMMGQGLMDSMDGPLHLVDPDGSIHEEIAKRIRSTVNPAVDFATMPQLDGYIADALIRRKVNQLRSYGAWDKGDLDGIAEYGGADMALDYAYQHGMDDYIDMQSRSDDPATRVLAYRYMMKKDKGKADGFIGSDDAEKRLAAYREFKASDGNGFNADYSRFISDRDGRISGEAAEDYVACNPGEAFRQFRDNGRISKETRQVLARRLFDVQHSAFSASELSDDDLRGIVDGMSTHDIAISARLMDTVQTTHLADELLGETHDSEILSDADDARIAAEGLVNGYCMPYKGNRNMSAKRDALAVKYRIPAYNLGEAAMKAVANDPDTPDDRKYIVIGGMSAKDAKAWLGRDGRKTTDPLFHAGLKGLSNTQCFDIVRNADSKDRIAAAVFRHAVDNHRFTLEQSMELSRSGIYGIRRKIAADGDITVDRLRELAEDGSTGVSKVAKRRLQAYEDSLSGLITDEATLERFHLHE